jgi:hypothetical protein
MIAPNELRIGNWVEIPSPFNKVVQIEAIEEEGAKYSEKNALGVLIFRSPYEHINPIPLTPEILERAGFGCRAGNVYYKEGVVDSLIYQYDGFIVWEVNNMVIKYLHWLQNLYFCLTTGKELEINDPVTK